MRAQNPSHALALVVTDELVRCGVEHAVVAPGSRSAAMAMALFDHPGIRLHVQIDERSAAFMALGIGRASGRPAAVVTTSGSATANLHPAVVEADESRVPLLALTADRPPELRQTGANQAIDQLGIYGGAVRWWCDVGVPESRPESVGYWRSVTARAVATSVGSPRGPVHLNLAFREPLVPVPDAGGFGYPLDGRPDAAPWVRASHDGRPAADEDTAWLAERVAEASRGVLVLGDPGIAAGDSRSSIHGRSYGAPPPGWAESPRTTRGDSRITGQVPASTGSPTPWLTLAEAAGWPVLAEPSSGARAGDHAVSTFDLLLRHEGFASVHRPELAVVSGRVALSGPLLAWLRDVEQVLVDRDGAWLDPSRTVSRVVVGEPARVAADVAARLDGRPRASAGPGRGVGSRDGGRGWLASWRDAERRVRAAVDGLLDARDEPCEPRTARDLAAVLADGAALVVASSMPVRDLNTFMRPRDGLRVLGNRGASGIDGFVSTVLGVATAHHGPTAALAGDLSLLHDANGLLLAGRDDLSVPVVVVNNDGGGIFSFLPQAAFPEAFEAVFGTPHGVDLARLAAAHGCGHRRVEHAGDLTNAVRAAGEAGGVQIVEVRTERAANVALHRQLHSVAQQALDG